MLKSYIDRQAAAGKKMPFFWRGAAGKASPSTAPAADTRVEMPKSGMMGARGMAAEIARRAGAAPQGMKKGGKVKKTTAGGSASKRADGCATKGKTKGRFV